MVDDLMSISNCGVQSILINAYINTHIEHKNLKFHTIDGKGRSKCHWMHVGKDKKNTNCYKPKVHGYSMLEVHEEVYLGEILQRDGKNTSNIESRINKGIGNISQIMTITKAVTFGRYRIRTGMLMRNSIFISSLLFLSEAWYDIKKAEM